MVDNRLVAYYDKNKFLFEDGQKVPRAVPPTIDEMSIAEKLMNKKSSTGARL